MNDQFTAGSDAAWFHVSMVAAIAWRRLGA
jgi:hypothetical protein